jgi:hypothetical protein
MRTAAEPLGRVGSTVVDTGRAGRRLLMLVVAGLITATGFAVVPGKVAAANPAPSTQPNFGANVDIFTPTMPLSQIQATVNAIATQQVSNQFGTQRYALLFEPGTYGTATNPLNFQVGYYTEVAGLGALPGDTVINGSVDVYNQCFGAGNCIALDNFWRSLSNLTINVTTPNAGCYNGEFWAVSQAAPMRRVAVNGPMTLMDYCSSPSFASGGFIADSAFTGGAIVNGSQQQFVVRNSNIDSWTNGVWNQVFSGDAGAPAQCFPAQTSCGPYTTLATSPVTEEEPFLYTDTSGNDNVFVPAVQDNSSGPAWSGGSEAGASLPIQDFFVASPSTPVSTINGALAKHRDLLLTPGVYTLSQAIVVPHPNTVVMGMGFATLVPQNGNAAMEVVPNSGVRVSGLIVDAGPVSSPVLLSVGTRAPSPSSASSPDLIQDVFFRIGGATAGSAAVSFIDNANNSIIDDVWAWRADHGNGVGWTGNVADTGLIVNGNNVTAYGLFVEHYQKNEIIWNGQGGTDVFFQNEMPYDPPSQAAWMSSPGVDGYPALLVSSTVTSFHGYGMGSYSFFNQGVSIFSANAFQVPASLPPSSLNDLLTIFLSTAGSGGILNVVDGTGGSSTIANPDTPVTVVSYP